MKEKIIELLQNENKGKDIKELSRLLKLQSMQDFVILEDNLKSLVSDGIVHENKTHQFLLLEKCRNLVAGTISINKSGNGFVDVPGGNDIYIYYKHLHGAVNGDFVLVEITTKLDDPEPAGNVVKILKRDLNVVIGEIVKVGNHLGLKLDDDKLRISVTLLKESQKGLVEGHKVVVRLVRQTSTRGYLGKVEKVIGHKNDPRVDILTIAARHNIFPEFSKETINELKTIPDEVSSDELAGRTDLTNEMIFTIDGDDTKDIDDAISVTKKGNGYTLGVHIADVSHYVKVGTALYDDAFNRGTSSYLADTVIPMIPHQLSNGICSLNPGVVRLSISCVMDIDMKGKITSYDIFPSFIKSRKQMTYKCVNKILDENIIHDGYEEFVDSLKTMHELALILRKEKESRGYIDFGIDEAKIIQDEDGKAIDIVKRVQGTGEKLIEDFMIAASETVAKHIALMDLPFIYRIHDLPNSDKIEDFHNMLIQLGYHVDVNFNKLTPLTMQQILEELREKPEFEILSDMLLRSMKKAIYSTNNIGHFGLASKYYTHFTSPIRRFPDLTVHRLLRTYLFEKRVDLETVNFNSKYLIDVADHSSETEVNAQEAERDVDDMKMAEYMESHIGEEYDGIVSGATKFGLFIKLDNLVEGLVHVSTLNGYYTYVPEMLSLVSNDKKHKYRIGDKVRVKVVGASKEASTIDFELIEEKDGNKKQKSII